MPPWPRPRKTLGCKSVRLAQHADDQVETMLLALSRGAGLPGLAAMPQRFLRDGMHFERPLLGASGAAIRAWLAGEGVSFIDDPTNADTAFTRNRIRHELLPALEKAFPQFRETFARSARHAAQAQELLAALAADDLAVVGTPAGHPALRKLLPAAPGQCAAPLAAHGASVRGERGAAGRTAGPGGRLRHARPRHPHQGGHRLRRAARRAAGLHCLGIIPRSCAAGSR